MSEKNDVLKKKGQKQLKSNLVVISRIIKFFSLLFRKEGKMEVIKATHISTIRAQHVARKCKQSKAACMPLPKPVKEIYNL